MISILLNPKAKSVDLLNMPGSDLISLIYVSSSTQSLDDSEISGILAKSRQNNAALGITGMLLYREGNFMQVLEGPEGNVRSLMQTVECDPRHRGLIVLMQKPLKDRQFADWTMAFRNLDTLPPEESEGYSSFMNNSLLDGQFRNEPSSCYRLLLAFKKNIR